MAILFMEGFDGYTSTSDVVSDDRTIWPSTTGSSLVTGQSGSGNALDISASIYFSLSQESSDTVWLHFYFKPTLIANTSSYVSIAIIRNGSTTLGTFRMNGSYDLLYLNGSGSTIATAVAAFSFGIWSHVQLKVNIADSGTIEAIVDGVTVIDETAIDTKQSTETTCNNVQLSVSIAKGSFDDLIIGDDSGSLNTDLIGAAQVIALAPDGAGTTTQWTPSAGSNYQNVDDVPHDSDTTYNQSSTATNKDTFAVTNVPAGATVYAAQVTNVAKIQSGSNRRFSNVLKSGATENDGVSTFLTSTYSYKNSLYEADPNTSTAWSETTANAIEIGYKLVD